MAAVAKSYTKLETLDDKRRKKCEDAKSLLLPQKKRVVPPSNTSSPAKKSPKLTDEGAPEETLIRETEAALKNLSGSWPGPRGYSTQQDDAAPAFENLFDEKKASVKMSPSSVSNSSSDNTSSLKDVITLRDQHEHDECTDERSMKPRSLKQRAEGKAQYQSPDFNELVDESSNELEIDMSEAASEKNEYQEKELDTQKEDSKSSSKFSNESVFHSFSRSSISSSSPFSTTSAFRPPQSKNPPLGPFPAEATFVGYPTESAAPEEKKSITVLKPTETQSEPQVKSPEAANKQYTILQPAGMGSRAASTIQEVARESVQSVAAIGAPPPVSEGGGARVTTTPIVTASLSPNSIGKGELHVRNLSK